MMPNEQDYVNNVLARFDRVRRSGRGWQARCPSHDDRTPSLSIHVGDDGKILLHCHRGCDSADVLAAVDLQFSDLYPPDRPATPSPGRGVQPRLRAVPSSPSPRRRRTTRRWEIRDPTGKVVAIHGREDDDDGGKTFWWEQPDGTRGLGGLKTADLPLYGIHQLDASTGVILVEGEKARDALAPLAATLGLAVVATVTGASGCPSDEQLRPLVNLAVYPWPDNDEAGTGHMDRLATGLRRIGQLATHLRRIDRRP